MSITLRTIGGPGEQMYDIYRDGAKVGHVQSVWSGWKAIAADSLSCGDWLPIRRLRRDAVADLVTSLGEK